MMVAYGFKEQFIEPTWSGRKVHTIRNKRTGRSRHARPGEKLQHYVAMRTKQCRKFADSVCSDVRDITIEFSDQDDLKDVVAIAGKKKITGKALGEFARSDGFAGWLEMRSFWLKAHGIGRFNGDIIYWKNMEPRR